ncbi:rhodanese-like domain-containing protein [Roseisolibacter sp. H3M3-2]|uniref:sulfurtransferase n=1 Tax=Roseisolibacter sp. H3M3-2 TaxID=3031323 RepID=UPI0023DAC301|nr:rhodanese-like domain-containing protein [Roseisolibacter sp. H3M3-2]MDF1504553.1 rhodanese-like domain-containing protein [Roseisolibacter sp. H3M3-2]
MRLAVPALAAALLLAPAPASAQADPGMVVTPAWLAARARDPQVVVLHVASDSSFAAGHVPGAQRMPYNAITARVGNVGTELPPPEALREAFEALGVGDSTRVVVYGDEAPMATRVLFTLDHLGHTRFALLDGGLAGWRAAGHAVETGPSAAVAARARLTPRPRDVVVTSDWLEPRLGKAGLSLLDTRTDVEYLGTGERYGVRSNGHLAGARQLQWEQLFQADRATLRPREELAALFAERVRPGDTVVTYCLVGYRASATYFVARLLGHPVKLYDGSYQDWSAKALALRPGAAP